MKTDMGSPAFMLALSLLTLLPLSTSTLNQGSHLSVENPSDVLVSPNHVFTAGFYAVGNNAYCFAVWFSKPSCSSNNCTIVWMANRNEPVNGRRSRLSLLDSGNVVLTDADHFTVWTTNTESASSTQLDIYDSGNLVLHNSAGTILWRSFDSPTDTLLPDQPLTRKVQLVSVRSQSNYSSGFFKLYFDNDNVLRLLFDGPEVSDIYWPNPARMTWENGRSIYNNSRIAVLDSKGNFSSTDDFKFLSSDFGLSCQRRLTIDFDGQLRAYSRNKTGGRWVVTWQAISQPCKIHGTCGPNSICSYVPSSGRKCSCLPGYKVINPADWSSGCEPEFNLSCTASQATFQKLTNVEFFGYESGFYRNVTLEKCESLCLNVCDCKGFQFKFIKHNYPSDIPYCYPKTLLLNGYHSPSFKGDLYLKVPKIGLFQSDDSENSASLDCSGESLKQLDRKYARRLKNETLETLLLIAIIVGIIEIFIIFLVPCFLIRTRKNRSAQLQGYFLATTGLKRFTYTELKKATRGFSKEIGRGAGGIVYGGILSDNRVAAVKQLYDANQGEAEFLAEITTIGKLNHINLIEMWGYCAEGKHRILVYEYMEHGSLAENLNSKSLDWKKRFDIAVGTAKCLAYLHEECLEWVLHCDIKPQNILLDSNYRPKVSDFGLSRLQNRSGLNNASFSRIRGTRGYMAPEWILNLPITSKVDVYSYGIVAMELVTGKSPATGLDTTESGEGEQHKGVATWVREKMNVAISGSSLIEDIIDPKLEGEYDKKKMEILVAVALKCLAEGRDARPTMSQVVEMLVFDENDEQLKTDGDRQSPYAVSHG